MEYLSVRNSKLISDLKRKEPLYDVYVKTSEELIKLRQAHTVLISMIQNGNINIKQNAQGGGALGVGFTGQEFNTQRQNYFENSLQADMPPRSSRQGQD